MPNLDASASIFNLDNRGPNASLDLARKTYNQVLTNLNWEKTGSASSQPTIEVARTALDNSRAVEVVSRLNPSKSSWLNPDYDFFYTMDSYAGGANPFSGQPTSLWFYDGETEKIDITRYLPGNNPSQQIIDLIGVRSDQSIYFTREITSSQVNDPNYSQNLPHRFELWKTNGQQSGTQLVKSWEQVLGGKKDFFAPIESSMIGDRIYITFAKGQAGNSGYEVWESQGTANTTIRQDKLSTLVQQSVPGLGKLDPKQYPISGPNYQGYLSPPQLKVQGYRENELYFTLESNLTQYRQPGYTFYQVWKLDQNTQELTQTVSFDLYTPLLPQDVLAPYLPTFLDRNVQGDSSLSKLAQKVEFEDEDGSNQYYFANTVDTPMLKQRSRSGPDTTIADFSNDPNFKFGNLAFGGDLSIPYKVSPNAAPLSAGSVNRVYFARIGYGNSTNEIWTLGSSNELQKIFTTNPNEYITGLYEISPGKLLMMTDQGIQILTLEAKRDAIADLVNGNYRALKQLAEEIGGNALAQEVVLPEFDTSNYNLLGIKDFDGDGDGDLLFQNKTSGRLAFWQMQGLAYEKGFLAPNLDYSGWTLRGMADFDRDGDLDLIWHHSQGAVAYWKMKGMQFEAGDLIGPMADPTEWSISGIGDFDGNQKLEILWRNVDGRLATWEIDNFKVTQTEVLTVQLDPLNTLNLNPWTVQAVTDIDGDGDSDLLLMRQSIDNVEGVQPQVAIWEMQNGALKNGFLLPNPNTTFADEMLPPRYANSKRTRYGGLFDLKQDGLIEIWWHSSNTGNRQAWQLKRTSQGLEFDSSLTKTSSIAPPIINLSR